MERIFQRPFQQREVGGTFIPPLHREVEHRGIRRSTIGDCERDGIGIFGDHLQAEIFEHRQRCRKRQHGPQPIKLQPQGALRIVLPTVDMGADFDRVFFQLLQGGEIVHGLGGRERVAIAFAECRALGGEKACALLIAMRGGQCLAETVIPGADGIADFGFQCCHIHLRTRALIAANNIMHAGKCGVVDRGCCGRHSPVKGARQNGMDFFLRHRIETLARHEDEGRDETVETVNAQEHAHLGPFTQPQDSHRGCKQFVVGNLKQFVARKGIENMRQHLAVVACGRKACTRRGAADLQAQQRNVVGAAAVRAGGEKADKAPLPLQRAVLREQFDADIIHMHAAVDEAAFIRFGDDERGWLGQ